MLGDGQSKDQNFKLRQTLRSLCKDVQYIVFTVRKSTSLETMVHILLATRLQIIMPDSSFHEGLQLLQVRTSSIEMWPGRLKEKL